LKISAYLIDISNFIGSRAIKINGLMRVLCIQIAIPAAAMLFSVT
jgi:hypothetical protein